MRFAVHDLFRQHPVGGFVENLEDSRVRIVVEGPIEVLDKLLQRLEDVAPGHIQKIDRFQSEATGEFHERFAIRR